ncbi:hypothetical protein Patl1_01242 [Pistacia atlantica]|uniref:Uncharacterized protein n=1 Tax=Pistacia atlantica TaxID=434234 RepID=A0ACC1C646_9ROSI|nr:hypothetical protein Patl1_01242 [Pistacia atlantica]
MATGFALANEDLLQNILSRLPALSFASAACVSKSWNKVCNRILSRPKLSSALSLSPSHHVAVEEVLNKVLSEPIRPHFAIACVGLQFNLTATHQLIAEKLGSRIPIITNAATGIIGRDAGTNELREVKWEILEEIGLDQGENNFLTDQLDYCGIVLVIGYVPGLKVDAIPLLRPKTEPRVTMVDKFLKDIRDYTASVSDCTSPDGIILFGDQRIDLKPILAEMDYGMHEETVIVGDASACFLFKSGDDSRIYDGNSYFFDAVALVFARDKSDAFKGEIKFHLALSIGVLPFGPKLKAVSVRIHNSDCSWLTARMEGYQEILDSEGLLEDINDQIDDEYPYLYIGVTHQRERSIGLQNSGSRSHLALYEVLGGSEEYFAVDGIGIKPGESFIFYHSDSDTASSSSGNAFEDISILKAANSTDHHCTSRGVKKEVLGGLIFSCCSRSESLAARGNVESLPLSNNFPGIPLAGVFCAGEIGRGGGSASLIRQEENAAEVCSMSSRCFLHHYSTVYLVMSYTPPLV